jgi:hypothetical protein
MKVFNRQLVAAVLYGGSLCIMVYPFYRDQLIFPIIANAARILRQGDELSTDIRCVSTANWKVQSLSQISVSNGVLIETCGSLRPSHNLANSKRPSAVIDTIRYIPLGRAATVYGSRFFSGSEAHNILLKRLDLFSSCSGLNATLTAAHGISKTNTQPEKVRISPAWLFARKNGSAIETLSNACNEYGLRLAGDLLALPSINDLEIRGSKPDAGRYDRQAALGFVVESSASLRRREKALVYISRNFAKRYGRYSQLYKEGIKNLFSIRSYLVLIEQLKLAGYRGTCEKDLCFYRIPG